MKCREKSGNRKVYKRYI